jgi:acyl-CoA thioesterase-1
MLARIERDVLAHQPSLVILMAGTNDRLNSAKFISPGAYQKNVEAMIERVLTAGVKMVLITPPPCLPELLYTRHDPKKYEGQSPNARMADIRDRLVALAGKHQLPLVNFHDVLIEKGIADNQKASVIRNPKNGGGKDGVHLTSEGYTLLAELIAREVQAKQLDTSKVVCLGDSLTRSPYPETLGGLLDVGK